MRQLTTTLVSQLRVPYVIHLEDNEDYLLESDTGMSLDELQRLPLDAQDRITAPDLIHPTHHVEFLRGAAGITVITEELNDFNVGGRPHHVARPGIDSERFSPERAPTSLASSSGCGPRTSCSSTTARSTTPTSTRC